MTTIAFDGKTLAADSQATDGSVRSTVRKLRKVHDRWLVGMAGTMCRAELGVQTIVDADPEAGPEALKGVEIDECGLLIVDGKTGDVWVYEGASPYEVLDDFVAIGNGAQAALAAMMLGKGACEAVSVASKIDPHTGGEVFFARVDTEVWSLVD